MKKRKPTVVKVVEEAGADDKNTALAAVEPPFTTVVLRTEDGIEPFTKWLVNLRDKQAAARVRARLNVVRRGSFGQTESVGDGVSELKIDYGPGYRIYYGRESSTIVVLIAGGDKSTQTADIVRAKEMWKVYKDEIENP